MKHFPFLFLLLACQNPFNECNMTISDACEIQFWPTGEDSFNLDQQGYTDEYCFHQRFLCTGERKFQGYDITGFDKDYYLFGNDVDGVELYSSIYDKTNIFTENTDFEFSNNQFLVSLTGWSQYSSSPGTSVLWNWNSPGINVDGTAYGPAAQSYDIYQSREDAIGLGVGGYDKFPAGQYRFRVWVNNYSTGGSSPLSETFGATSFNTIGVGIDFNGVTVTRESVGTFVYYEFDLVTTQDCMYFGFGANKQGSSSGSTIKMSVKSIEIIEYPLDYTITKFSNTMIPSSESMCDKFIQFKIFDGADQETDTELFYSDFIDFVSVWANSNSEGRVDIQYRSIQNFAGLLYDSESEYFNIQLDGRFRKERKINVQKSLELTEMIINTAASVKKQRKLSLNDLPDYMHTKISLILAHAASGNVLVDGIDISVEEAYEEGSRPDTYPMTPSEIFLTVRDFYKHNVI